MADTKYTDYGTSRGGYTCSSCGGYKSISNGYSCYCTGTVTVPSGGTIHTGGAAAGVYSTPIFTTTTSTMATHINWQEYVPARPPLTGDDYLIVYIDSLGSKKVARGSFSHSGSYHYWKDEGGIIINTVVTHYAKIELPY